ncbi:exported protein of unknown function [Nitrosotalea devaniterrae]|uniref:Uncharacterized protein n=1 Tax=Nitrosotalea devaniterrae TaxID=1078905 RepID=A0A128A5N8_9ARCH|nr:exported protein of unknown function [Candidatus Nitrosotalea devanaterra]
MENKIKTTTITVGLFAIFMLISSTTLLPAMGASANASNNAEKEAIKHASHKKFPHPPDGFGCGKWTNETGWIQSPCVSPDLPHPTEGNLYDLYGQSTNVNNLSEGTVEVSFATFTSETDDTWGSGAFSIQANTNQYQVSGVTYETQFDEENPSSGTGYDCVWQINVSGQDYSDKYCSATSPQQQTLSSSYDSYVDGYIDGSGNLVSEFCSYQQSTCWSASHTDDHNLSTHWSKTNGNILGYGNSSNADFTSPTDEYTYVTVFSSSTYTPSTLSFHSTDETNNLSYISESQTGCSSNNCQLFTESTN